MAGLQPYSVSMSPKDIRDGLHGSRSYYTAKDLSMRARKDKVTKNHVYMLIDVDYYVDMPKFLDGKPAILYTMSPELPGDTTADSSFSIDKDIVTEKINGGAVYRHRVWDYDADVIVVDHTFSSTTYLVEQRCTNTRHRKIILLEPVATTWLLGWLIPGKRLTRKRYSYDSANYIRTQRVVDGTTKVFHAMSLPDSHTSAEVDDRTYSTILTRCALSKQPQISDVERILRELGDKDTAPVAAGILVYLWRTNPQLFEIKPLLSTRGFEATDAYSYQALGPLITEDGTPSMRAVCNPIVDAAYAPVKSHNNDHQCINGRVHNIRNEKRNYPPFIFQCMHEFISCLIPSTIAGTGVPLALEQVEEHMTRPSQRADTEQARNWTYFTKFMVKSFQKSEAYGKITDPRNISTVPTDHKLRLSKFTYPLADLLKQQHWYAFGKHPREITRLLREKAARASSCVPSDLTRLDGSTGTVHSQLIQMVVSSYFAPIHHGEIIDLVNREHNKTGVTTTGVRYDTGHTTISGSPITSIRNSIINAFHCYVALRLDTPFPTLAYANLGMYGGDDGITFDVEPKRLHWSFRTCGLTDKTEIIRAGNPVGFLGRIYLDLWTTDSSIIDVPRQISKLHLTACPLDIPNYIVLYRKACSYLVTDPDTYVISQWAKKVVELVEWENDTHATAFQKIYQRTTNEEKWWAQYDKPYPELTYDEMQQQQSMICTALDISVPELDAWLTKLNNVENMEELMKLEPLQRPKIIATVPAVHRDIIHNPPNHTSNNRPPNEPHRLRPRQRLPKRQL